MKKKTGTGFMVVGAICILAALASFLWNQWEAEQADRSAQELLRKIKENMAEENFVETEGNETGGEGKEAGDQGKEEMINGCPVIGYLSIPALNLELPVLSQWDYKKLRIAPCRYSGSAADHLVIAGHNYARHFGTLSKLSPGDEVSFVDLSGTHTNYATVKVEVLKPTSVEEMTAGEYDLTLFTCTYGGKSRLAIRCEKTGT